MEAEADNSESLRDVQVVHPWHFRLLVYLVTGLGAFLLWCWFSTLRVKVINPEVEKALMAKGPLFCCTWHRGVVCSIYFWRGRHGFFLASAGKDGEWAAGLIRRLGNVCVRGSSSRGGRAALKEMVEHLRNGVPGGLIPDAPRGPERISKVGALVVAQRAGVAILPTAFAAERCWRLKNWDHTIIPKPFSRFVAKYGEPFTVDPSLEGEALSKRLAEFDLEMNRIANDVDGWFKKPAA